MNQRRNYVQDRRETRKVIPRQKEQEPMLIRLSEKWSPAQKLVSDPADKV